MGLPGIRLATARLRSPGVGLFDVLPLPVEMGSGVDSSFPFDTTYSATGLKTPYVSNATNGGSCVTLPLSAYCQAQASQSNRYYVMQFDPKRNYVMQWNFNIQRQHTTGTSVMVGYVGARGRHMRFQADDVNMVYPSNPGAPNIPGTPGQSAYPLTWPGNTDPNPTGTGGFCADQL